MDFRDDDDRGDTHRSVFLLILLLGVPILGAGGLLVLAVLSAMVDGP